MFNSRIARLEARIARLESSLRPQQKTAYIISNWFEKLTKIGQPTLRNFFQTLVQQEPSVLKNKPSYLYPDYIEFEKFTVGGKVLFQAAAFSTSVIGDVGIDSVELTANNYIGSGLDEDFDANDALNFKLDSLEDLGIKTFRGSVKPNLASLYKASRSIF